MRLYSVALVGCLLCLSGGEAASSAPFANLDFDDVVFPPGEGWDEYYHAIEYGEIATEPVPLEILPNWDVNTPLLNYTYVCLGTACVTVRGNSRAGDHSVFLQGGYSTPHADLPLIGASISQTGDVPEYAKSIRFSSTWQAGTAPESGTWISYENLELSLDGVNIPLVPLEVEGSSRGSIVVGGDIEAFAGTNAELIISTRTPESALRELWAPVDDISFSATPIPEPPALMLLLAALLCLDRPGKLCSVRSEVAHT